MCDASPNPEQFERPPVSLAQHVVQWLVGPARQPGVTLEQPRGAGSRDLAQRAVANRGGDSKRLLPALSFAEQVAHAAKLEVRLGDLEPVVRAHEDLETPGHLRTHVAEQNAEALRGAAADATAKLMELGEAEALRMLDEHHGGIRDVDADLDRGGRDEDIDLAVAEMPHRVILDRRIEAAVQQRHAPLREAAGAQFFELLRGRAQ